MGNGDPLRGGDCRLGFSLAQKGEGIHSGRRNFWRADGTSFTVEDWAIQPARRENGRRGVTCWTITGRKRAQKPAHGPRGSEAGSRDKM